MFRAVLGSSLGSGGDDDDRGGSRETNDNVGAGANNGTSLRRRRGSAVSDSQEDDLDRGSGDRFDDEEEFGEEVEGNFDDGSISGGGGGSSSGGGGGGSDEDEEEQEEDEDEDERHVDVDESSIRGGVIQGRMMWRQTSGTEDKDDDMSEDNDRMFPEDVKFAQGSTDSGQGVWTISDNAWAIECPPHT